MLDSKENNQTGTEFLKLRFRPPIVNNPDYVRQVSHVTAPTQLQSRFVLGSLKLKNKNKKSLGFS